MPSFVTAMPRTTWGLSLIHIFTGWAQINYDYGSSDVDALEKLQYEFFYLRHQSLTLDLRIIGRTLRTVFEDKAR